ncbi:MAG: NAD(P)H-hydrate epimerase [Candidatus Peregrinibacteria bacterium]
MKALEDYACKHFGMTVEQMMQNAGKAIFDFVQTLDDTSRILVVIGKGNNGGDALVAARLLHEAGKEVTVINPYAGIEFTKAAAAELDKAMEARLKILHDYRSANFSEFDLIIDGLFGFSLKGDPKPPANAIIEQINCSNVPVLAVDVPSGLDVSTGTLGNPTVRATHTLALGIPKFGFQEHPDVVGQLHYGNLGIPREAYEAKGYKYPEFIH